MAQLTTTWRLALLHSRGRYSEPSSFPLQEFCRLFRSIRSAAESLGDALPAGRVRRGCGTRTNTIHTPRKQRRNHSQTCRKTIIRTPKDSSRKSNETESFFRLQGVLSAANPRRLGQYVLNCATRRSNLRHGDQQPRRCKDARHQPAHNPIHDSSRQRMSLYLGTVAR